MNRAPYDLAVGVLAGVIVFALTETLDWLDGWRAWVVSAVVAGLTFGLLVFVIKWPKADGQSAPGFRFMSRVRGAGAIEIADSQVVSDSPSADMIHDVRAKSIKVTGSEFRNTDQQSSATDD